jgi:enoyl-CoA hydratase/carnithine racemase
VGIISGQGRAFCTGIDLGEEKGQQVDVDEVYLTILDVRKPLLAAVHGYCLAQGAGIALNCDIRIAADDTKFGWPQATRGMISLSGTCLAAHHMPKNFAYEAMFTGELFDAAQAERLFMINRLVPRDKLMSTTEEMARKIASNAPLALQGIKEATSLGDDLSLAKRLRVAKNIQNRVKQSKDFHEGIAAFLEKRKPVWRAE